MRPIPACRPYGQRPEARRLSVGVQASRPDVQPVLKARGRNCAAKIGPARCGSRSRSRQAWLARHRQRDHTYDSFGLAEVQARVDGGAAIVTARNDTRGSYQGHPIPEATRATLVLVGDVGNWQLAAAHMSFIAGTRGAPPFGGPRE